MQSSLARHMHPRRSAAGLANPPCTCYTSDARLGHFQAALSCRSISNLKIHEQNRCSELISISPSCFRPLCAGERPRRTRCDDRGANWDRSVEKRQVMRSVHGKFNFRNIEKTILLSSSFRVTLPSVVWIKYFRHETHESYDLRDK